MTLIDKAEALDPCPFCTEGKTVSTYFDHEQGDKWGYASCDACGARGPEVRTSYDRDDNAPWRAEAIAAWNRRAALPARGVRVKPDAAEMLAKEMQAIVAADRWKGRDMSAAPPEKWSHLRPETQQFWIDTAARILAAIAPTDAAQAREAHLREAAAAVRARYMGDNNREDQEVLRCEAAILALIGERT